MTIPQRQRYPRTGDHSTVYLQDVITDPHITVGAYTMYNDFVHDPALFEKTTCFTTTPSITTSCTSANSARWPAAAAFFSPAPTIY